MLTIRKYKSSDCGHLAELFYQTVHAVNAEDYSEEQLNAWADGSVDLEQWDRTFSEHYTVVAVKEGGIVGFGDIDRTGYLDRLYVHKDYQGQGIASAVCDELEKAFLADKKEDPTIFKITVHASITAKPFFLSRGYRVIKEQQVSRKGISLTNYIMEKQSYKF